MVGLIYYYPASEQKVLEEPGTRVAGKEEYER
jgi:hypothetical protein